MSLLDDELIAMMAEEIRKEIDQDILEQLERQCGFSYWESEYIHRPSKDLITPKDPWKIIQLDPDPRYSPILFNAKKKVYDPMKFLDAGYVYAPYIPLQMTPISSGSFTSRRGVRNRYHISAVGRFASCPECGKFLAECVYEEASMISDSYYNEYYECQWCGEEYLKHAGRDDLIRIP